MSLKNPQKEHVFFRNIEAQPWLLRILMASPVTPVATEQQSQTGEITKIRLTSDFDEKGIVLLPVSIIQHHNHHMNKYVIYNIL